MTRDAFQLVRETVSNLFGKLYPLCFLLFAGFILEGALCAERVCAEVSDEQILEFNLSGFSKQGKATWKVRGESADIFKNVVKLKNIIADLYGEEDTNLTADKGLYDKVNSTVHLQDNVVALTSSGSRLTTDSLDWDINSRILTTPDIVKIEREGLETEGRGGKAETLLKKVELKKDITVKINSHQANSSPEKSGKSTVITCDGPLEIDYQNNIATFNKNVHVTDNQGEVFANFMEVYFSKVEQDNAEIYKIIAKGEVKIVRGENTSFSEEAEYLAKEGKLLLKGRPKLVIYQAGDLGVE